MISIDIEKRLKAYSGCQVLHVQTEAPQGSITKIYGPSGSGKTTFLKAIAGLVTPEKGTIRVEEETWLDVSVKINLSPQKRKCGFVFQNYALFPNMSVLQHLQYATNDGGWIKTLLDLGKLEPFASHKPDHLSGGQQQRLAILRALAIKPTVLLMDEPFSALDMEMKLVLIKELRALLTQLNITTFIVSHNPQEMEGWYDQEIYIRDSSPVL